MALLTPNAGHKTDSASVVLVRRIVKTLLRRQTVLCLPAFQEISPGGIRRHRNQQRRTTTPDSRSRAPRPVYIFGTVSRGQKYNSEFRFGGWKFQETLHIRRPTTLKTIDLVSEYVFSIHPIEKPVRAAGCASGIVASVCRLRSRQCRRCPLA
jgi:hypothetical protein